MPQPNRNFDSQEYHYGFQGQEKDPELKGEGLSVNYKYRMHDPRIGRFFAVDPLAPQYPHYSPYSFSGNKVTAYVELEGLEELKAILLNNDYFSFLQFDFDSQLGKAFIAKESGPNIFIAIDNNQKSYFNKVAWIENISPNIPENFKDEFITGVSVPPSLLEFFKEEIDQSFEEGLNELKNVMGGYDYLEEYTELTVGLTREAVSRIVEDVNAGRAKLIGNTANDAFKTIVNENGQKENLKFSDGYIFNVIYEGEDGALLLQFTLYTKEQTREQVIKEEKEKNESVSSKRARKRRTDKKKSEQSGKDKIKVNP